MKYTLILPAMVLVAVTACTGGSTDQTQAASTPAPPARYEIGHPVDSARLAQLDIDISPTGAGLPAGHGTATQGAAIYAAKCASCHGPKGEGMPPNPKLVGRDPRDGFPFGNDVKLAKTVGNYWPYATTVFDYVRRTMPYATPGTLTNDEAYSVVAWLLAENEIIPATADIDAKALAAIKMPARDRFVPDNRLGVKEIR